MGGLFKSARDFFGGLGPPIPSRAQSFSVRCPEGHRVSGVRTEGYQALRCPTCGEGVFVLPRSPLPEPDSAPSKKRPVAESTGDSFSRAWGEPDDGPVALTDPIPAPATDLPGSDLTEASEEVIEWVDEEDEPPELVARPYIPSDPTEFAQAEIEDRRKEAKAVDKAKAKAKADPADPPSKTAAKGRKSDPASGRRESRRPAQAKEADEPPRPRVSLREWALARRNPLIFGSVVAVVLATVAYRSWSAWWQELPRIAERGRTEGLEALDAGKFDAARQLLSPAKRAVERLGGGYDPAAGAAIRQGALEIEIITDLVPNTLEAMLEEASRADPKTWEETFNTLYQGRSIIIEDQFREVPDGSGKGRYDLYYRIFRPGEGAKPGSVGRIDLTGLTLLESRAARVDDYVILGARLASFRYDLTAEEWKVGLEPNSGVTMTHRKALDALNWPGPSEFDLPERDRR